MEKKPEEMSTAGFLATGVVLVALMALIGVGANSLYKAIANEYQPKTPPAAVPSDSGGHKDNFSLISGSVDCEYYCKAYYDYPANRKCIVRCEKYWSTRE